MNKHSWTSVPHEGLSGSSSIYQDYYKGILFDIRSDSNGFTGYLLDIEYVFSTYAESRDEVLFNIINYIDSIPAS